MGTYPQSQCSVDVFIYPTFLCWDNLTFGGRTDLYRKDGLCIAMYSLPFGMHHKKCAVCFLCE